VRSALEIASERRCCLNCHLGRDDALRRGVCDADIEQRSVRTARSVVPFRAAPVSPSSR
jgi:hypothetical protein